MKQTIVQQWTNIISEKTDDTGINLDSAAKTKTVIFSPN
jgi:hypothetical protein